MSLTRYIIIDKKDDVYLKIEADEDIRRELGQFFTFEVPGFKFMPQFRNRVWDGKIRLFSYQTGQIYVGLYPYILKWCEDNNVQVVDGTKIQDNAQLTMGFVLKWAENEVKGKNANPIDITEFGVQDIASLLCKINKPLKLDVKPRRFFGRKSA